ncbi:uncharacterized protein LOC118347698 [Juglans regia]|uniref:Uncharacterized protein LOC118347698 n=1 Tax=Juglans regia TaxID=51240 RepID=A0A6P9E8H5_JUGRE|nr:uncharacterized protein LOC118347698 [Juglans regia]
MANSVWSNLYKDTWVEVMATRTSDHKPLLMHILKMKGKRGERKMGFKYEAGWALEKDCERIIKKVWEKKELQKEETGSNIEEIRRVKEKLNLLLEMEDLKWKQRAKCNWYKYGDKNTKYFHDCANQRRKKNLISSVYDENKRRMEGFSDVEATFRGYFESLVQSSAPSKEDIDECLVGMEAKVTAEMNDSLMKRFSRVEVEEALMQMAPLKAPGPDVLINGFHGLKFWPKRGLRQGDPLSPYLFIICAEGLSNILNFYEKQKLTRGVQVTRGGSSINHLLFADDCILFGRAKLEEWHRIQEVLKNYEKASGQFLNKEKTSLFFSSNTREGDRRVIVDAGNSIACGSYEKYLGLPTLAGKEILIKAVLQAIPTYTMSVFKLPKRLCRDINLLLSRFWWVNQQGESSICWRKWEKMGKQKSKGGLGFRDVESFNMALLAKQGWRLIKNPMSLAARVFKEKYFRQSNFMDAKLNSQPSLIWRSIWQARELVKDGVRWRVGDGSKIKIWGEKWLPSPSSFSIQSPISVLQAEAKVEELIDKQKGEWREDLIRTMFSFNEAEQILSIPLSRGLVQDKLFWGSSKIGEFSVGSAYFLQLDRLKSLQGESSREGSKDEKWSIIWNLTVPNSVKIFLWKVGNNLLPTKENLFKRKIVTEKSCTICFAESETIMHAIWECPAANDIWADKDRFPKTVLQKASEPLVEYKAAQALLQQTKQSQVRGRGDLKWEKPAAGLVKINWDASLDVKDRRMGVGIIIRDEEGEALVAVCDQKEHVDNPMVAESYALRVALDVCGELNIQRAIFEGDAKSVITAVHREAEDLSLVGFIVEDIKFSFHRRPDWQLLFVFREKNIIAHILAGKALSFKEKIVWIDEMPDFIVEDLERDRICIS